jgi:hypothetical protein
MSGYLERLVDRHARPPAVRSRSVSRFEGDLVGASVVEVVVPEDRPVVAATSPALTRTSPVPTGTVAATPPAAPPVGRSDGSPRPRHRADAPSTDEAAAPPSPPPATPAPGRQRPEGPPERTPHDEPARTRRAEGTTIAPVRILRADPPSIATPADGRAVPSRRSTTAVPTEPDVVHVHIGRVEVRATGPAHEASRPTPRPARPAPLSLDRYLTGERRT